MGMRFILPLILALLGAGAGVGAGLLLKPEAPAAASSEVAHSAADAEAEIGHATAAPADDGHAAGGEDGHDEGAGGSEFTKLNNQFVVPVVKDGRVASMVVLSLSLETEQGQREVIYAREPRIRDTLLQILFDHANAGGFDGTFTSGASMDVLRGELYRAAKKILGTAVIDVLVTDIARQDLG